MDDGNATCERVLFAEKEQVMTMLKQMAAADSDATERKRLLKTVTSALEKYLEQPHLLDPHLEGMMAVVMGRAKELVLKREAEVLAESGNGERGRPGEAFPFQVFINPQLQSMFCVVYQLCRVRGAKAVVRLMPHEAAELEPVIHALQAQDTDDYSTWETRYGLLLWLSMLSLVPFDIDTIDSGLGVRPVNGEESKGTLSVQAPGYEASDSASGGRQADLVGTILALGMKHLGDAGPTRDAAAACLSSLLTRPDMEACHLRRFLEWSASVLERVTAEGRAGREGLSKLAFLVMGVMATLAALFKQGHREKLIGLIPVIFYPVIGLAELGPGQTLLRKMLVKLLQRVGTTYVPPRVVSWRYHRGQRSLLQNLASAPDSIHESGTGADKLDGGAPAGRGGDKRDGGKRDVLQAQDPEGGNRLQQDRDGAEGANPGVEPEADVDVPEELEDIVEALLCGLRDRDTVVRWSAAKGIGRITERLPQDLADDVVCSVLDLFVEAEWDGAWHGACLALAELARRGLLLPERLPRACPLVRRALAYDVRRGAGGVGAHVRDAACYVCWAFARAYSPQVLGPHLPGLCDSMLSTALFDREINVRRAAAAAFQENVGRQGQSGDGAAGEGSAGGGWAGGGVAHGIDIITAADYFSLGNRQQAYLEISKTVASFDRYRRHLVDSLRLDKLRHWDTELRRLAALALGNVAPLEPLYAAKTVLPTVLGDTLSPDLLKRHGACLAASEVILALGKASYPLSPEMVAELAGVVPALEKARLYRGRGGELMRQAACRVVESLALTKADVTIKTQLRLLDSIDESLRHPVEEVQLSAAAALKAVLHNWFPVGAGGPSERLQARTIGKYVSGLRTDENAAVARGHALALGVLPRKLAGASRTVLGDVLEALKDAACGRHGPRSVPPENVDDVAIDNRGVEHRNGGPAGNTFVGGGGRGPGGEPDAETRRNAVRSLADLCEEVGVGGYRSPRGGVGSSAGGTRRELPLKDVSSCDQSPSGEEHDREKEAERDSSGELTPSSTAMPMAMEASDAGGGISGPLGGEGSQWRPEALTLGDVEGVLAALLAATEDYSVDKRGDVGSWCRMDAMTGLERLMRLASRASRGVPLANRGDDASMRPPGQAAESFVLPCLKERLALLDLPPMPVPSPHPCDQVYITPSMMGRVMCAVLKQLSEKLDAVRERAGTVLERLMQSDDPQLPFIPERRAVKHAMREAEELGSMAPKEAINWASPAATFPIVVGLLAVSEYHDAIAAGLVVSVGGLSESVVKQSSNALLRWFRACNSVKNRRAVAGLALRLVGMFGEAKGSPRVVVPLLKTVELLLSNECFDFLAPEDHPFAERLLAAVSAELKCCRDVKKICLGASVFVCMLDYGEPVRAKALRSSVLHLGHRFPKVRKTTAEALYLKLLANESIVDEAVYDEVLDLLTGAAWDGDLQAAKVSRSALATLLNVSVPAAKNTGASGSRTPGEGRPRKADELESYESLVRSTGY